MAETNQDVFAFRRGTKYYRIIENEAEILRIVNIKNNDSVICMKDEDYHGKIELPKIINITKAELYKNYRILLPNGQLCITGITTSNKEPDVMIAGTKIDTNTGAINGTASSVYFGDVFLICRQMVYDVFSLIMDRSNHIDKPCYGLSISRKTCPANIEFDSMYKDCIPVGRPQFINIYQQDNIDQILGLIKTKDFDATLASLYNQVKNNLSKDGKEIDKDILGFEPSLEKLVKNNGLMYDIQSMFDIIPINNIKIKYHDNKFVLSTEELQKLEYVIKSRMSEIMIVKLSHFVSESDLSPDYSYVKICDSSGTVYLIQYTPVSGFAEELYPEEVRNDVINLLSKYNK